MFKFKKEKGFTLIELLIVVAILGILAALLIPNAMAAMQKAKQKGTMKDINTIATGTIDYLTDKGIAPNYQGDLTVSSAFYTAICPFYVKAIADKDQWGEPFKIQSGPGYTFLGCTNTDATVADEFVIGSYGRDKVAGTWTYSATTPNNFFVINSMADFKQDLANWNGTWVSCPRMEEQTS